MTHDKFPSAAMASGEFHSHRRRGERQPLTARAADKAKVARRRAGLATAAVMVCCSLLVASYITIAQSSQEACEQRADLAQSIITIIDRSNNELPRYVKDGLLSREQARRAQRLNRAAINELRPVGC